MINTIPNGQQLFKILNLQSTHDSLPFVISSNINTGKNGKVHMNQFRLNADKYLFQTRPGSGILPYFQQTVLQTAAA